MEISLDRETVTLQRAPFPSFITLSLSHSFFFLIPNPPLINTVKTLNSYSNPILSQMPSRQLVSPNPKSTSILRSKLIFLTITLSATTIFLFTIIFIVYYLWDTLFHPSRTNPFDTNSNSISTSKLQRFSYKELKLATNGFDPDHSIGKGGSATVFRGVLRDGKTVAIKRLNSGANGAEREFQCELTVLGGIVKSPLVVSLLGFCIEKNIRILVYEYMPNSSLQELLFSDLNTINWEQRWKIIQDVTRAIKFLHNECDPPVIHGDIKPSNVLLDWDFSAKISDFGLSRVKGEDGFGVEMFSQEIGRSQDFSGNLNVETPPSRLVREEGQGSKGGGGEVDFALALQASGLPRNGRVIHNLSFRASPKGKEVLVEDGVCGDDWRKFDGCYDQEVPSIEHSKELEFTPSPGIDDPGCAKELEKDWWWKQDESGELSTKDYDTEWIGCQTCPTDPEWKNSPQLGNLKEEDGGSRKGFQLGCVEDKGFDKKNSIGKHGHKTKPRKMQDWWKEEELDEMSKRGSKRQSLEMKMKKTIKIPHFDLGKRFDILKRKGPNNHNQIDKFSFKKVGWRKKHTHSMGSEMSGDLLSRELSSTTSMRGTLCYVAPEFGGCGYLMEKGDIYSLGVLILVIISGRRPLHVLNSPMKLEKANLISWCRHLAQAGNVLELIDERLKDVYNKEQAILCIHLALACLQRVPELRPEIGDIVKILKGEIELPPLPFEFSPSPPSKLYSKSRRKQKTNPE